jgi:hypothetical protein
MTKVESFYNTSKQSLQSYEYGFIVRCVCHAQRREKESIFYRRTFVRPGYLKKVQPEDKTSGPRLKPRARKTKNKQNGHGTGC